MVSGAATAGVLLDWAVGIVSENAALTIGIGAMALIAIVCGGPMIGRRYGLKKSECAQLTVVGIAVAFGVWILCAFVVAGFLMDGPIGPDN
jgi:hypothetical protein